jgi:ketosteroid isomerase-like protein
MSEAYVELVDRALEAVIRADYREASDCFRADAEWHNTRHFPGPLTCVGPRAIIDFWTTLVESFDVRDPVSPVGRGGTSIEQIAVGNECVVVGLHSVAWGKGSGTPLDLHWAAFFSVTAGEISRVDVHGDWKKALRVAGVEDPPMSQESS